MAILHPKTVDLMEVSTKLRKLLNERVKRY